jgi:hypothetical protein
MLFQLRRYYFGLVKYKSWLLFFLIPPLVFLFGTALIPSHFIVSQQISCPIETPVARMSSPTDTMPVQAFLTNPEKLFLHPFTLKALYTRLHPGLTGYRTDPQMPILVDSIQKHMTLYKINDETLVIRYSGPDLELGNTLVSFFSERWVQNAMEGIKRSAMTSPPDQEPGLSGMTSTLTQRTVLPSKYLPAFLQTIIFSLFGALIFAGILEFKDSSFKSERQMAQYLKLPILGSLPNLDRVYSAMKK